MRRIAIALVTVVLAGAATASASRPVTAAGGLDFQVVSSTNPGAAGGNTFYTQTNSGTLTGTLSGTFETRAEIVVHADGSYNLEGTRTCACTLDGRSGTVTFHLTGGGSFGSSFFGRLVAVSAEGELTGFHSVQTFSGTFVAPGHGSGAYTGSYHVDGSA